MPGPTILDYLSGIVVHRWLISCCAALALAAAVCWIVVAPSNFTASATMIIYNRGVQIYQQDIVIASLPVEASLVQNQIELLESDKVILAAFDRLGPAPAGETEFDKAVKLDRFKRRLKVEREGTSHAVSVKFTSTDPQFSAEAVNAVVDSYLADQKEANEQASQATSAWLKDRVKGLGANARVISTARPPPLKDGPGRLTTLLIAGVVGVMLGIGIALVLTYIKLATPGNSTSRPDGFR